MKKETKRNGTNINNGGRHKAKRIHLEFVPPIAEPVAIAVNFNEWQPNATPMIALGQGRLGVELGVAARRLRVLPGGGRSVDM